MASIFDELLKLDPSFGEQGEVTTNMLEGLRDKGKVVTFQHDGKMIVAGESVLLESSGGCSSSVVQAYVSVARYSHTGELDASFGQGGIASTDFNDDIINIYDADVQHDGKILVAGSRSIEGSASAILVVRYNEWIDSVQVNGILNESGGDKYQILPISFSPLTKMSR